MHAAHIAPSGISVLQNVRTRLRALISQGIKKDSIILLETQQNLADRIASYHIGRNSTGILRH